MQQNRQPRPHQAQQNCQFQRMTLVSFSEKSLSIPVLYVAFLGKTMFFIVDCESCHIWYFEKSQQSPGLFPHCFVFALFGPRHLPVESKFKVLLVKYSQDVNCDDLTAVGVSTSGSDGEASKEALSGSILDMLPTVQRLLKILATLPVSTSSSERSSSTLRRLKTYLRNTTGQDRLNGLAILNIHRDIRVSPEDIVNRLASRTSLAETLRSSPAWVGVDPDSCMCREPHDPCPISLPLSRELLTKVGVTCLQSLQFCCDFEIQQKEIASEKSRKPQTHSNTASKNVQSITDKKENGITSLGVVSSGQEMTKNIVNQQQKEDKITDHVLEENASSLQGTKDPELHVRTIKGINKKETQVDGVTQAQILSENKKTQNYVSGLNFEANDSKLHKIEENDGSDSKSTNFAPHMTISEKELNKSHYTKSLSINTRQVSSHNGPHAVGENEAFRNDPDYDHNLYTEKKCDPEDFSCVTGNKEAYKEEPTRLNSIRSTNETKPKSTEIRNTSSNSMLNSITSLSESEPISLHTDPIILGSRYQPIDMSFTNSRNNSPSRAFKTIRELTRKGLSFTIFYWIYVAAFLYVSCYLLGFIMLPFSVLGFIIKIVIVQFFPAIISLHFFHAADIILEFIYDQIS
ncbi:uncharacterized protein LOC134776865 [Penaeus indicus]|uniref:uncharacterized protein LOC134776865 n=1 Tax=Penaeus indicus TaxID=29960 RepID=UPI00300D1AD7